MERRKRGRPKGSRNRPKEERLGKLSVEDSESLYPLSTGPLPPAAAFNFGSALSLGNPSIFTTMGPLGSLLASSLAQPQPGALSQPFGIPFSGPTVQAPSFGAGQPQAMPRKRGRPPKAAKLAAFTTVSGGQALPLDLSQFPAPKGEAAGSRDVLQGVLP